MPIDVIGERIHHSMKDHIKKLMKRVLLKQGIMGYSIFFNYTGGGGGWGGGRTFLGGGRGINLRFSKVSTKSRLKFPEGEEDFVLIFPGSINSFFTKKISTLKKLVYPRVSFES